jgi:hypothetical protein
MGSDVAVVAVLAEKFAEYRPHVDERAWRLYLGAEARAHAALNDCSLAAAAAVVAAAAGVSRATVTAGAGELAGGAEPMPGRSRRPGAGRPRAEDTRPGLKAELDGLLEEGRRGDPVSALAWTVLSLRDIARQLALRGFPCGKDTAARLMHEDGYSLQGMSRVLEGRQHEDRDLQFGYVSARIADYLESGDPVISTDTKKKELIGNYHRPGRSWQPKGGPVKVRDHDFPDPGTVTIAPYGVYDIAANRGFVSVGTSRDTGAFAVNAIRLWWQREGQARYPGARRLLVTCDAGGSNDCRFRLWKDQLAILAEETGLAIEVCHFPPGTSKWNKIEHRLFCHVTRTWRARPLRGIEDAVAGIAATATAQGLKCTAVVDDAHYPDGRQVSGERMDWIEARILDRDSFHGDWNYTVLPAPRQGPLPAPEEQRARRPGPAPALLEALTALAGVPAPAALHAEVAVAWHAERERALALARGGPRTGKPHRPHGHRRLSDEAALTAAACRIRLGMTWRLLAVLFGLDYSTIGAAARGGAAILEKHGITGAGAPRITTLARLREAARAAGIDPAVFDNLPEPEKCPQKGRRKTPATRTERPTK